MEGVHRFLARAWRLFEGGLSEEAPSKQQLRELHSTIKRVRDLLLGEVTAHPLESATWGGVNRDHLSTPSLDAEAAVSGDGRRQATGLSRGKIN